MSPKVNIRNMVINITPMDSSNIEEVLLVTKLWPIVYAIIEM